MIGAPGADKVFVISGKDQSILRTIGDPDGLSNYQFGFSVADVGDWGHDGIEDFAVGVGDTEASKVHWFNGADGRYLAGIASRQLNDSFGFATALVSDYDGDGIPGFFIAAPAGDHVYLMNKLGNQLLDVGNPAPDTPSLGTHCRQREIAEATGDWTC